VATGVRSIKSPVSKHSTSQTGSLRCVHGMWADLYSSPYIPIELRANVLMYQTSMVSQWCLMSVRACAARIVVLSDSMPITPG